MKVETLSNGAKLVRRYKHGCCYAAVWSSDSTDKQVAHDMAMGDASFFPYNESTGEFDWLSGNSRPKRFKK